jgi:dCMP deaminase
VSNLNDLDYLDMAYSIAQQSQDPSTQNGALVVWEGIVIGSGANNFPRGVVSTEERWVRPAKYSWVEHAERNAIFDAAKHGRSTQNATMYCPWFACTDCARAIIQAGIIEVVGHATPLHDTGSQSWKDSIAIAYQMFDEAGVHYRFVEGDFQQKIRFNEQVVEVYCQRGRQIT